jgi:hypothetical protein
VQADFLFVAFALQEVHMYQVIVAKTVP